ncbi:hypothetical protein B566_EDAN016347 [Ephemera danica]|nr:hypothetical protein B566_EDAN016347 [Ephemera danica]
MHHDDMKTSREYKRALHFVPRVYYRRVKRVALKKKITFKDYTKCLRKHKALLTQFRCIRSMQHQLYTVEQRKVALSSFHDKRYILPDGICTLAHGHKGIPEPMDTSE